MKRFMTFYFEMITFQHASPDVDRMLIGNKCDCESRRQISRANGERVTKDSNWNLDFYDVFTFFGRVQLATEYGIKLMEVSAKENIVSRIGSKTNRKTNECVVLFSCRMSMKPFLLLLAISKAEWNAQKFNQLYILI